MDNKQRSIRFKRPWQRRPVGLIAAPSDLTFGQRATLVQYGFAEWVDETPPRESKRPRRLQEESVT